MASLNEQSFERKLQNVNTTQDSIQTLSLWCIHHKSQHKKIVNLWMKVLKKSKSAHRLCLFYLCNDVVQNSRRRGAPIFLETFKDVLEEAASLARDPAIRPNILRIFTIWEERSVFDSEFVEKLHASVVSSKVRMQKVSTRFLADFRPQTVTEGIEKFHRMESELELKQKQLTNLKVDVTDTEALRQLKAAEPIKPTASAARTLTKPRPSAADTKPVSKTGYGPIPTVTGVTFSSFMSGGLPSTVLPTSAESTPVHTMSTVQASNIVAYSPSSNTSAPSPVGSPVDLLLSPKPNTKTNPIVPAAGSNVNTVDSKNYSSSLSLGSGMLDLDSRLQQVMQNAPSLPQSLFHSPTRSGQSPSISTPPSQRTMIQTQSWGDSPISVTRHLPALSSPATSTSGGLTPSQILGLVQANTQQPGKTEPGKTTPSGTPLRDEGGTPVQDEDTKVPSQSNPIDFLSQLITSTRNAQGGNTSSNFLSGLAALTETMKSAMRKQQLGGSKSNWPETEGGFPPLGLDPNNPLSESIASIATHSLTSTAASIMTSASTHVLTTPPTNILTSQPPQTLKSPASMYTQAVPTSFPPPVVSPVQLFSPTGMFPEPISAMQTPLGQMPVVVSTVLTSTSTASTAASIDSITQNPVASDHHSGMENSHDVQSIIPVSSINQSVSAAVSMSENITTNYPTTAQHESFDTLAVSVSQPSTEEQPEPQIETMENSIPVVEPTSPIPVLGGSRGGFPRQQSSLQML
uniref:Mucin-17-like n=1 Tax=Saccoglossus kowalevskii TaxID=10224 RepID=A0ABM0GKA1_SACKO|nr:PREDICTED: mucin-17-like [Saccoglossus kowalevskii]